MTEPFIRLPVLAVLICAMPESRTIETLQKKRDEILRAIAGCEEKIAQAQADLAHINATITIFGASYEGEATRPYVACGVCAIIPGLSGREIRDQLIGTKAVPRVSLRSTQATAA